MVRIINWFATRLEIETLHVSTLKVEIKEVIVIWSIGRKVGGDRKLLIWNENLFCIVEENIFDEVTVNAVKLPKQLTPVFTF